VRIAELRKLEDFIDREPTQTPILASGSLAPRLLTADQIQMVELVDHIPERPFLLITESSKHSVSWPLTHQELEGKLAGLRRSPRFRNETETLLTGEWIRIERLGDKNTFKSP
jgi:hypothetical protein